MYNCTWSSKAQLRIKPATVLVFYFSKIVERLYIRGSIQDLGLPNSTVTFLTSYAQFFITCKPTHQALCYDNETLRKMMNKIFIVKVLYNVAPLSKVILYIKDILIN